MPRASPPHYRWAWLVAGRRGCRFFSVRLLSKASLNADFALSHLPRRAETLSQRNVPSISIPTNRIPSKGTSRTVRPITAPQKEHPAPSDQSQPLKRNIPHRPTNHSPSKGTSRTARPITAPQKEYKSGVIPLPAALDRLVRLQTLNTLTPVAFTPSPVGSMTVTPPP
eukprot:8862668-Pyramimonas_sp.AAC.1